MQIATLPYHADTTVLFAELAQQPWSIWLDSNYPQEQRGRYDIFSTAPYIHLSFDGQYTHIYKDKQTQSYTGNPLNHLRQQLAINSDNTSDLPFQGGAIGYWSYDLNPENISLTPQIKDSSLPLMAVGIYDWAVIVDHHCHKSYLVSQGRAPDAKQQWQLRLQQFSQTPSYSCPPKFSIAALEQTHNAEQYQHAFNKIKAYIQAGDCYQVNFAQRFHAKTSGHAWHLYQQLRQINPAPYAAYMNLPQAQILCSSPEQFIQQQHQQISTSPIKGTCRQYQDTKKDQQQQQQLLNSAKDRAENIMIVDLMRNDLGKVCDAGSIHVPELCALHSFATVHHLISTVKGQLSRDYDSIDLLQHCFPGGSITGAPKKRAMEIIAELESHQRGLYCGSIGYISYDGKMDTNIAIRTLVHDQKSQQLHFWAGGGIVANSTFKQEYQESFDKAAALIHSLKMFQTEDNNK